MSRIDNSTNSAAHLGAGRGAEATSAPGLVRIDRLGAAAPRTRIEARRRTRQLKALASATQVAEQDMAELRERPRDDVISRLSRILLAVEAHTGEGGGDEIDNIFNSIVNEHVRRLLLVRKPQARNGQAGW
jgi:hypothetical protein